MNGYLTCSSVIEEIHTFPKGICANANVATGIWTLLTVTHLSHPSLILRRYVQQLRLMDKTQYFAETLFRISLFWRMADITINAIRRIRRQRNNNGGCYKRIIFVKTKSKIIWSESMSDMNRTDVLHANTNKQDYYLGKRYGK